MLAWLQEPLPARSSSGGSMAAPLRRAPQQCTVEWAPLLKGGGEAPEVGLTMPLLSKEQAGGEEGGAGAEEVCNPLVWWALL